MMRIGYQNNRSLHEPVLVGMIPWVRWFLLAFYLPRFMKRIDSLARDNIVGCPDSMVWGEVGSG